MASVIFFVVKDRQKKKKILEPLSHLSHHPILWADQDTQPSVRYQVAPHDTKESDSSSHAMQHIVRGTHRERGENEGKGN